MRLRVQTAKLLSVVCLGVWGLGASPSAQAQGTDLFRGGYTLAGRTGVATYAYDLVGGDTVRTGDFDFRAYAAEDLLSDGDDYVDIGGQFGGDGRATGSWRFDFGELSAADVSEVRDLRYHLAVDGERRRTVGRFERGRAEGEWRAVTERIRRSQPTDTLFYSRFDYSAGTPQQTFSLGSPGTEMLGLVTREGLAEDTWVLFGDRDGDEEWRFHDGLLLSVTRDGRTAALFEDYAGDTLHVALDEGYLRLLDIYLRMGGRDGLGAARGAARLLRLNAAAYAEVNAAIAALGLREDGPRVWVAVPSVPLGPREEAQLERISAGLLRFNAEAAAVLGDEALRRVAGRDDEVAFLRAAAEAIEDEWVAPIRRLDTAYHRGLLRSLPRVNYLATLWPAGAVDGLAAVTYDGPAGTRDRTFGIATDQRFDIAAEGLPAVGALLDYAIAQVGDIRARLAAEVAAAGGAAVDLVAGASRIEVTYARLDSLVSAQPRRLVKAVGLNRVARLAEATVNGYRGLDALGRQRRVADVNRCLDDLYGLAVTLRNLPTYEARVEDAYTDEVWNNIIATVMTERVKKRITEAYRERLVPYFLTRVREGLSCDNAAAIDRELNAVHERVMALRDVDTEALEDELRGVRDPRRLLALLSVTPVN